MFFTQLAELRLAQVTLGFSFSADNDLITVSVLPKVNAKDEALKKVKPLTLTGTAEELDKEFFQHIQTPIESVSELYSNVKAFEQSVSKAKSSTEFAKKQKEKVKKELDKMQTYLKGKDFNPLKDYAEAIKLAKKVLDVDPKNKEALKTMETMTKYDKPTLFQS